MANTFPNSLNNYTATPTLLAAEHWLAHNTVESKLGTGASTPAANTVLRGTGTGTSSWTQLNLGSDVSGTLLVQSGGTGATTLTGIIKGNGTSAFTAVTAPTGAIVGTTDSQTLTNKTLTSPTVNSPTGIVKGDVGLGSVDNTSDATKNSASVTLTNKRVTRRTGTVASSATPTINSDTTDFYSITALAVAITSMTTNLSGTPTEAQTLWIAITDNGTARAITWGASFEASGTAPLPTTTVIATRLDIGFVWNVATSKWRCVATA